MNLSHTSVAALLHLAALDKSDWKETLEQILRVGAPLLGVQWASYWSLRPEVSGIRCEMAYEVTSDRLQQGLVLHEAEAPSYFAELRGASLISVNDARADPRTAELRDYLERRGVDALLDVPIWLRGRLAGVLCAERRGAAPPWTQDQEALAAAVAQSLTAALEARSRRDAEAAERRASLLDEASLRLSASLEPVEVAERALALLVPSVATSAALWSVEPGGVCRLALLYQRPGNTLVVEGAASVTEEDIGGRLVGRVIEAREAILLPRITDERMTYLGIAGRLREQLIALDVESAIGVPLFAGDRLTAVLLVASSHGRYGHDDLQLVLDLGRRIALALENARLYREARDAVRARDQFLSLAAHELHTPLTSLGLAAEALTERAQVAPRPTVERMSQIILRQARRLGRLIGAMLDTSRIGAGQFVLHRERADLAELVREEVEGFSEQLSAAGCAVTLGALPPLVGWFDRARIGQVLGNLLDNAIKFSAGKPIEVSAARNGEHAIVWVRDHGIGIPPDRQRHVFDPYERAVSPRSYGGLGLGLYISRTTVEAHGGTIGVESLPGEGSTFTVRLPLAEPAAPDEGEPPGTSP